MGQVVSSFSHHQFIDRIAHGTETALQGTPIDETKRPAVQLTKAL